MARAAITGAAGFIGANLVRRLIHDGHEVHALLRPASDAWRLKDCDLPRHSLDLRDPDATRATLAQIRPDWVFHCAAHGAYSSQQDHARIFAVNLLGTTHLLDAAIAAEAKVIVNLGSSSEYGPRDFAPSESEAPRPDNPYGASKAAASLHAAWRARHAPCRIHTLRLYSVCGPWEEPTRFIPTLVLAAMEGRLPPLVQPDTARDFIYVDDVVEACLAVATHPELPADALFNIGTGRQTTIAEAVACACRIFGVMDTPQWGAMPARSWDTAVWVANPEKARQLLGWRAAINLEHALRMLAAWFEAHPALAAFYRARIQRQDLPR